MQFTDFLSGIGLIIGFFAIFYIGKFVHDRLHPEYDLNDELVNKDNPALALAIVGYYGGLVMAVGGSLVGPSNGFWIDLFDLLFYGLCGVILLNLSWTLCDKVMLATFKVSDELIRDRNLGTGAVSGGCCLASGFVLYGAIRGEGSFLTMIVFWAAGQALLLLAGWYYDKIVPYDIRSEIEKDNVPAGVSFAGAIISMGLLIGLAAGDDFESWRASFTPFIIYSALGLAALPVVRWLCDKVLLPGVRLTDEIVNQEVPNLGAAYIEAFSYIAGAMAIYWCV